MKGGDFMFKSDLVKWIAKYTRLAQRDVSAVLDRFQEHVTEALARGDRVQLPDLGVFYTRERKEARIRDVRTRDMVTVPAGRVVGFRVGARLKRRVFSAKPRLKAA